MLNMKRLSIVVGIGTLSLFIATGVWAAGCCPKQKGQKESSGKHLGKQMCPMHIKGAEVKVENTKKGVIIYITAEDSKVVKEIQKIAVNMKESKCCPKHLGKAHEGKGKKEAAYICPMGEECYKGPKTKDGRCPECGMKLKKVKKVATYVCPMGDYKGPKTKDGRCPECGMKLKKVK